MDSFYNYDEHMDRAQKLMVVIKREELHELVWSKPIKDVAAHYHLSHARVISFCKKMGVRRPPPGYWGRTAKGQKSAQKPLGPLPDDCVAEHTISYPELLREPTNRVREFSDHPIAKREFSPEFTIHVPDHLDNPHPVIHRSLQSFKEASADEKHILTTPTPSDLNVLVTQGTLSRSLRIMNTLLDAFDKRGWKYDLSPPNKSDMYVTVLDRRILFRLHEKIDRIDHVITEQEIENRRRTGFLSAPRWDYIPSGRLRLSAPYFSWMDGKRRHVEGCLNNFCAAIVQVALEKTAKEDFYQQRERERQVHAERIQLQEQKKAEEIEKRKAFINDVKSWDEAERMRRYLDVYEQSLQGRALSEAECLENAQWLKWARNYVNILDPCIEVDDYLELDLSNSSRQ